jgi:hypothetical protein
MTERDFKAGDIVITSLYGEMLLVEKYEKDSAGYFVETPVWKCLGHGPAPLPWSVPYRWIRQSSIVRKATIEDLLARREQAVARGVDCKDPDCWCREYVS